jgi:dTDP-4-amino-4,6-dideoxygalactose transaminase
MAIAPKVETYARCLQELDQTALPDVTPDRTHIYNYYTLRKINLSKRNQLQQHLRSQGVASAVYYPLSLHLQEV